MTAARRRGSGRGPLVGLILGGALVTLLVVWALTSGLGPSTPGEGEVAVVNDAPDGTVTAEDFDRPLEQIAARQQLKEVPPPDDPQYEAIRDAAISDLLLARWVRGEAEDRGLEVSEREIDQELETIVEQQFGSRKEFETFLKDSGFTDADARERVELQLLSQRVQEDVLPSAAGVAEEEIERFYETNLDQFSQPETRDVREIVNTDEAELEEARAQLERDDSPQSFEQVAREFSTDPASKSTGGLREGVVEGQSEPELDAEIFSAPLNELIGPFPVGDRFYLIQVTAINEEATTPLAEVSKQIEAQLQTGRQQQLTQEFQQDFITKWTSLTQCAEDFITDRCANFTPPDTCPADDPEEREQADPAVLEAGCEAPVLTRTAINPGTGAVFTGQPAPALAQRPLAPPGQPDALAPGALPIGPDGAPLPPGAAPPGTAPPGTAPPGTAPPGTAPPGTAPPPGG